MSDSPEIQKERPQDAKTTPGQIILGWWSVNIADRQSGRARALAAKLRRASAIEALSEPEVMKLAKDLQAANFRFMSGGADRLARLATLSAEVRTHTPQTLLQRLGGEEPILSRLRFQRLIRAEDEELTDALRRAIQLADEACNVAALGEDLLFIGEKVRKDWCFEYFGSTP